MVRLIDADELKSVFTEKSTKAVCGAELCKAIISRIYDAPTVNAVPIQYILTTIREWNSYGYAESAEALEILLMNWDKENME